ncbi:unnamed protein product [Ectocarpus sp. 6 AP-2014]
MKVDPSFVVQCKMINAKGGLRKDPAVFFGSGKEICDHMPRKKKKVERNYSIIVNSK